MSEGVYHPGVYSPRVNGAFTFYDGQAHFYFNERWKEGKTAFNVADSVMRTAAQHHGMGFWQDMLIHNYKIIEHERPDDQVHRYRSLCLYKDRVCVIQSDEMPLGDFIQELVNLGVQEALYIDMGTGWNHSWYRKGTKQIYTEIFPKTHPYQTNWITFYK